MSLVGLITAGYWRPSRAIWTPANIPNLWGWWSMAGTGTIRATGSGSGSGNLQTLIAAATGNKFIVQIDDLSGNGNHLVQATEALQPQVVAQVNGLWTCDSNGTSQYMEVASPKDLAQPNTVAIVFQLLSIVDEESPNIFYAGKATGYNNSLSKHPSADKYRISAGSPTDTELDVDMTEPRLITSIYNGPPGDQARRRHQRGQLQQHQVLRDVGGRWGADR